MMGTKEEQDNDEPWEAQQNAGKSKSEPKVFTQTQFVFSFSFYHMFASSPFLN